MLDYNFNEFVIINSLYFFFIIYLEEDFFFFFKGFDSSHSGKLLGTPGVS